MHFIVIFAALFLLLPQNANLSPILHHIFKRDFSHQDDVLKELIKMEENGTNMVEFLRHRKSEISAFGYSLLHTYLSAASYSKFIRQSVGDNIPQQFKTFFGPPKNGANQMEMEDLQCFENCLQEIEEKMKQKMGINGLLDELSGGIGDSNFFAGKLAKMNCSDEIDGRICLGNCRQKSGKFGGTIFLQFQQAQLDWFLREYCPSAGNDQIDVLQILNSCRISERIFENTFSYTFKFGGEFVNQFNKADEQNDGAQKCSVVKKYLIDEFGNSFSSICGDLRQAKLMKQMLRTTAGYYLAKNTEGDIINRCPNIYTVDRLR